MVVEFAFVLQVCFTGTFSYLYHVLNISIDFPPIYSISCLKLYLYSVLIAPMKLFQYGFLVKILDHFRWIPSLNSESIYVGSRSVIVSGYPVIINMHHKTGSFLILLFKSFWYSLLNLSRSIRTAKSTLFLFLFFLFFVSLLYLVGDTMHLLESFLFRICTPRVSSIHVVCEL